MKYINIIRHSYKMSLYRPRSEWIIIDKCCPCNIHFASKLQGTLTYCCYFPLYYPHFFEKYKMKNYIHICSRITWWYTVTTYNEILTYRCQKMDHEELSLDDAICLVAQFASQSLQNISPKVLNWMAKNCVQGPLTVVCAHDWLSISVKWRLYSLISEIRFSDIG